MFDRITDNANINEPQVDPVDQGIVTNSLDQEIRLPDADEQGSRTQVDFETSNTGKSDGGYIIEQTEPTEDPIMDSLDALGQNDKFKSITKRDSGYSTKWLAENLIRQGDIVLIEGKPGAGATLLATGISGGLCRGIIFGKLASAGNSRVLYLEGSMRQTDLENNVASLCEDGEELEINIKTAEEVYRITNGNILTLISPSWREHIKTWLTKEEGYHPVVVFDKLNSLFRSIKKDDRRPQDILESYPLELRRKNVTQIWVNTGSGSSVKFPDHLVDLHLEVETLQDRQNLTLQVSIRKGRHINQDQKVPFLLELIETDSGHFKLQYVESKLDSKLYAMFLLAEGLSQSEVARKVDRSQGTISLWRQSNDMRSYVELRGQATILTEKGRKATKHFRMEQ